MEFSLSQQLEKEFVSLCQTPRTRGLLASASCRTGGIHLPKSFLSVRTEGPFLCKWFIVIICATSSQSQGLFIFYINSYIVFQRVSFPALALSCPSTTALPTESKQESATAFLWGWLWISLCLWQYISDSVEQAGERSASCRMQANMRMWIIMSPFGL